MSHVEPIYSSLGADRELQHREERDGYLACYLKTAQAHVSGFGRKGVAMRRDGTQFPIDLAVSEVSIQGSGTDEPNRYTVSDDDQVYHRVSEGALDA